ncbi:MAG: hypothetical protein Q8L68_06820 [Methylococcales bacterium]|nr:hypothetical protein [Methylococcales bacterium]
MRIITFIIGLCCLLSMPGFAASTNIHAYPGENHSQSAESALKSNQPISFGGCEIEIINDSFSNVTVYGRYDDGIPLIPFNVYSYEFSHYIDLYYNGYCHSGIYLSIVTFSGSTIFSAWVYTGSTLHIVPMLSQLKVNIERGESDGLQPRDTH